MTPTNNNKEDAVREIKFRAWDGKKWWQGTEIRLVDQDPELIALFGPTLKYIVHGIDKDGNRFEGASEDTPIVWYTGLKDKNGKEIYEGDVLSGNWLVVWREAGFYLHVPKVFSDTFYMAMSEKLECEIIGNIMENPELLK